MSMGSIAERLDNVQTMRRKDQARRRAQLVDAARALLLEHGALGLRVKDIAARAGISSSAVLYYYPDLDDLLLEVTREAMSRYAERRADAIRGIADPAQQLRVAISLGVPTGPDDEDSRLLYELDAMTGASKLFATLSAAFFDRQAMLYERVLERGVESDAFQLSSDPLTVARGLVALEDGLGLQVVLGHPGVDREAAEAVLLAWAEAVTGAELRALDPIASGR
jgi:AcrR family transcriptional regulator